MKKLLDLPQETIEALQKLAKAANRSLKNYMETVLIEHVKEQKKKNL